MSEEFRFSPAANRAHEVNWRGWGQPALDEAAATGRPVLLNLTAVWCEWCHRMDEQTFSDSECIRLLNEELVPVRVDCDRYPHVQDRYIAGGWPTTAFLTPTGEVLWAGTFVEPAEFRAVADSVVTAWRERREELETEIGRRRGALDAARGQLGSVGLVRREPADDVLTAVRAAFDARNGGFGDAPKFPHTDAVELLYAQAAVDPACVSLADQTLDGMLAGELWDGDDGGFFRYALATDWTDPRREKLLDTNAALLEAYALGAALRGRDDWRDIAERTVAWVDDALAINDGFRAASLFAATGVIAGTGPLDSAAGRGARRPPADPTLYTSANARWFTALATAGARLDRQQWVARAHDGMSALLREMRSDAGLCHFRDPGSTPQLDFLLTDVLESARAALALAQATGDAAWLDHARALARHIEAAFWSGDGGFWERSRSTHDVGALRYRDRPLSLNAAASRALLDLAHITGERGWRALAEGTLARFGPQAGRYGADAALLALAIEEYFERPPCVVIVVPNGPDYDAAHPAVRALRRAAFALPVPQLRVWTVPAGHSSGPHRFPGADVPVACIWTTDGCSPPIDAPERLADATAAAL
jgi:uncharacterized protein